MGNWPSRPTSWDSYVKWDDFQKVLDVIDDVITPSGSGSGTVATLAGGLSDGSPDSVTLAAASAGTGTLASRWDHHHPLSQGISPTWTATHNTSTLLPRTSYSYNIGALTNKYLSLYAAELWVETLVAQNTIATIGGRVLVGPTNTLIADAAAGNTTIDVKYNNLTNGDRVYMEANGKVEWMAVTSGASVITGGYRYSVTRNLDGSGADAWSAGDAVFDTGTTGNGYIDLYSVAGVIAGSTAGPTIVGNARTGTTYSDIAPRWAIGNLKGLYDYASSVYGFAAGDYTATWLAMDATNGLRIKYGAVAKMTVDVSGNASFAGSVTASSGTIGGWTIGAGSLSNTAVTLDATGQQIYAGTGNDIVVMNAGDATYRLFVGNATPSLAPFSVSKAGALVATSATITGAITASSGSITGPLTMSGASSSIAIGTTPPTSATVGTGLWLDRTGLYGLAANVQQVYIQASDGLLYAGGGKAGMDNSGLWMLPSSGAAVNYFAIRQSGDASIISRIFATRAAGLPNSALLEIDLLNYSTGATLGIFNMSNSSGYWQLAGGGLAANQVKFNIFSGSGGGYTLDLPTAGKFIIDSYDETVQYFEVDTNGRLYPGNQATRYISDNGSNIVVDGIVIANLAPKASPTFTGLITASGGQIAFPATQSASADANTLDDYEEGTWSGTLTAGTSGTITLASGNGTYTKVGRAVTITCFLDVSAVSSPVGSLTLNGLPFTCVNSNGYYTAVAVRVNGLAATATTSIQGYVAIGTTTIILEKFAAGVPSNLAGDVVASANFMVSCTYFTT